jgi:PhoPQ-activated pathogenicity-related protein
VGGFSGASVPGELSAYIALADPTFEWTVRAQATGSVTFRLTSQTWRGVPWVHSLNLISYPNGSDTAILYLTGGDPNPLDDADAAIVAAESGLPTAMMFNVPTQPIFGKEEDALIAHTFDAFLEDRDTDWPLLFPMAKSVIRAMDALEAWSNGRLRRFVLMGESKRAWTTWMAAATGDSRISGIAPAAFDNLNMVAQMAHQLELWDRFSPAIHDYTDLGLQARIGSGAGKFLARLVDPYTYLPNIKARILQVHGANDAYWAPDARLLYQNALPEGATLLTLPNEGHSFTDKSTYYRTAGAFAHACAADSGWPEIVSKLVEQNILLVNLIDHGSRATGAWDGRMYVSESATADFTAARWDVSAQGKSSQAGEMRFTLPKSHANFQAAFAQLECNFEIGGGRVNAITLSTPTTLLRS